MKKKQSLCLADSGDVILPPAYPVPGYKIFRQLRAALAADLDMDSLKLERLAKLLGVPVSTAHQWFCVSDLPHLQALLCLMERLPWEKSAEIMRPFLRDFPSLCHPRLARDSKGVERLERLLRESAGLTIVRGGSDADRTFLLTAIGHTFQQQDALQRMVVGMDVHEPRKFVPLESVLYFRESIHRARLTQLILERWPQVRDADSPLLLFNEIVSAAPRILPEILELTTGRHIVVADTLLSDPAHLSVFSQRGVVRVVTICPVPGRTNRMQVSVHRLDK